MFGKIPEDAEGTRTAKLRMLAALEKTLGIVTQAADKCKMSNRTHYNWIKADPDYKAAVELLADKQCDFIESALMQKVQKGDTPCIIFAAKCKLKRRGYYEKVQIAGDKDDPLVVKTVSQEAIDAALKAEKEKDANSRTDTDK